MENYHPRMRTKYRDEGRNEAPRGVSVRQRDDGAATQEDRPESVDEGSHPEREAARDGGGGADAHRWARRPSSRVHASSIANFKLREGMPIGARVTLRGTRMWEFAGSAHLRRHSAYPRLPWREPEGLRRPGELLARSHRADHLPRDRIRQGQSESPGLNVAFQTTAETDEEGRALLRHLGMPFAN